MKQIDYAALVGMVLVASACSDGTPGKDGADAPPTVAASEPFGANDQCPNGGVTVSLGPDLNGNGKLDNDEPGQSFNLCSGERGSDGQSPIVVTTAVAPGDDCPAGGKRIDVGLDNGDGGGTAGNRKLESGEVDDSTLVCDGATGATGATGASGEPGEDGDAGPQGDRGYASLIATSSEGPGSNCTSGGQRIASGVDMDGDGALDGSEQTNVFYVCDGADAASSPVLAKLSAEPAGANCANGGQRIDVGADDGTPDGTADNSILEDEEISSTSYVCNGAPGDQGEAGVNALVESTSEAAGSNCATGGIKLTLGLDDGLPLGTASNGVLEADEIESTRYVCNGATGSDGSNGSNGSNGSDGFNSLVQTSVESAGANCVIGGVRIESGLDDGTPSGTARNGNLEAGEVQSTRYVCNGANGTNGTNGLNGTDGISSLIKATSEAAGANCTTGGTRYDTGADDGTPSGTARNGVLDAGEIESTRYVCNGATGANGANGTNGTNGTNGYSSLQKVTSETAGANCASGGVKLESGLDDGTPSGTAYNGVLEAGETTSTQYICNGSSGGGGASSGVGTLVDSNGTTLGAIQTVNTGNITLRSPTGYYYIISWTGTFPDQQIYYSVSGCTGTMWLNGGSSTNLTYRYGKYVVYEGKTGNFFLPANVDANGVALGVAFSNVYIWNGSAGGTWSCGGTPSSNGGWLLTPTDRTTVGIPANIVPPFSIN